MNDDELGPLMAAVGAYGLARTVLIDSNPAAAKVRREAARLVVAELEAARTDCGCERDRIMGQAVIRAGAWCALHRRLAYWREKAEA